MDLRGDIIFCDASQGAYTATLPPPALVGAGYVIAYKKTDASENAVTIAPAGSETIDGQATVQLTFPYQSVQVATNGANWFLLPVLPFAGGGVVGPKDSTNNALAAWDGTGGTTLKDTPATINTTTGVVTLGGSAPGLASASGVDIAITPGGSGRATLARPSVSGGVEGDYADLGDVATAANVGAHSYTRAELTGDTTFTIAEPTGGTLGASQGLELEQDETGGWVPTFAGYTMLGALADLNWGAQPQGTITVLSHFATPTGLKFIGLVAVVEAA